MAAWHVWACLGLALVLYGFNYYLTNYILDSALFWTFKQKPQWECARVAVYEHVPLGDCVNKTQPARQIINLNLEVYKKAIEMAAREVSMRITFRLNL